jgi:hypothetical protein
LLLLQEVRNDEGPAVQHFVCYDCLDLVERKAESTDVHDCPAVTQQARRMQLTIQRPLGQICVVLALVTEAIKGRGLDAVDP